MTEPAKTNWQLAIDEIAAARRYTLALLDDTPQDLWYRRPIPGATHVAWQVGHLAAAQYRLTLERIRGPQPLDEALIDADHLRRFGIRSVPADFGPGEPAPAELLARLRRVEERAFAELPSIPADQWLAAAGRPHPWFDTKLGSLLWCARHEMLHAGQIGLLRRLFGLGPRW